MRVQTSGAMRQPNAALPSSLTEARGRLRRLGVRAAKGLGQHFLVDPGPLDRIVAAAELRHDDTVVEVGPGLGILTAELAHRAGKVIAVEIDSRLASALANDYREVPNVTVLNANVLDLDIEELVSERTLHRCQSQPYKVVANLPYYVASPILRHFLEASVRPLLMVVMVQKEVAQSMAAQPGAMSLLAIAVQLYGRPTIVDYVGPRSFYPQPKVDSAIVRIDVYTEPAIDLSALDGFFEVVKAGFSSRRKQLRNALASGLQLSPPDVVALLDKAGIAPHRRAQTLSLPEWAEVHRAFVSRARS